MAFDKKAAGIAKAKNTKRILTGDKELDATLNRLKVSMQNKIARRAIGKALTQQLKRIKAKIPAQYKDAKKAIGMRNKVSKNKNVHEGKVGAGVGKAYYHGNKKSVDRSGKLRGQASKRSGENSGGVGIGGRNVHWLILGTGQRKRKSFGKNGLFANAQGDLTTGRMPPQIPDAVKGGFSKNEAMATIRKEVSAGLLAEAKRVKK